MKRLLVIDACVASMVALAVSVALAVGIEIAQAEKRREWRPC